MAARKVDLGFYCLGNGIAVANRAVKEYGDYKNVAHISVYGRIRWYVKENYLSAEDKQRIIEQAENYAKKNKAQFEKLPENRQYATLLDNEKVLMKFLGDKRNWTEKLPEMRQYYYEVY